jgi:cell division protein FtsB
MIRKKKKKTKKEKFSNLVSLFTSFLLIFFLAFSNFKIAKSKTELKNRLRNLTTQLNQIEEKNRELKKKIGQVEKESFWEEKIREEGYVKEGEEMIVIKGPQKTKESTPEKNRWQKFLESLKNFLEKQE